MFNIDRDMKITITRGDDSGYHSLFINEGSKEQPIRYVLKQDDKLYLGIFEPNGKFENALVKQIYTSDNLNEDGDIQISFKSKDTLKLKPGLYYYQVKLKTKSSNINNEWPQEEDYINTIIGRTTFNIVEQIS